MKKIYLFIGAGLLVAVFTFIFVRIAPDTAKMRQLQIITHFKIGEQVPDFELMGLNGTPHHFSEVKGAIVMFHFWSATCPYVVRYNDRLNKIESDYTPKGVVMVGINSNAGETAAQTQRVINERGIHYPILMDPGNKVADLFGAVTTPHVFIVDQKGTLVYSGAVDDQGWSKDNPVTKRYTEEVLNALIEGKPLPYVETKTAGCTVKRK